MKFLANLLKGLLAAVKSASIGGLVVGAGALAVGLTGGMALMPALAMSGLWAAGGAGVGMAAKGLHSAHKKGWLKFPGASGEGGAGPDVKDSVAISDRKIENGHVFDLSEIGLGKEKPKKFSTDKFLKTLDNKISKEKSKDSKKHMQFILDKCNSTIKDGGSIEMPETGKIKFNIKEAVPEERHEDKGPAAREVKAGDVASSLSGLSEGKVSTENTPVKEQRKRDLGRDFRGLGAKA